MKRRQLWLIPLALCLCGALLTGHLLATGQVLPLWVRWQQREIRCDAARGEPETIRLTDRTVRVYADGEVVWQSEAEIPVQDVLWCDIDHDSRSELLLLCWRRGRYGRSRPFWETEEDRSWSQHIFIYDWTQDEGIRPIWMASDIRMDAAFWEFDPVGRLKITDRSGQVRAWDWLSWGLEAIDLS